MKAFFKSAWGALCCFLLGCLFMSFLGSMVNTSGYTVDVTNQTVDMDKFYQSTYKDAAKKPFRLTIGEKHDGMVNAKMNMNVYLPKGVSEKNPRPAICLTHGYLNSKEFEEAPAIELSKRGYVVFEYDQYDHGDSTWDTPSQFNFYVWSAYDAMEYAYAQKYVLKDANGNGMIAVSGHSMGGFSSELAVAFDEINNLTGVYTYQKVNVLLAAGADFRYDDLYVSAYSGGIYKHTYDTYANRSCGTLAAKYDEFFFNNTPSDKQGTVVEKDFAKDPVGYSMLGLTQPGEDNVFYKVSDYTFNPMAENKVTFTGVKETGNENISDTYGERIIYRVAGDHPYNTWSPEATARMVDFYDHSFKHQFKMNGLKDLNSYGVQTRTSLYQSWWLKEIFTCVGLFCLVGAFISLMLALIKIPGLRKAKSEVVVASVSDDGAVKQEKKKWDASKWIGFLASVASIILSAFMIPYLLAGSGTGMIFARQFGKYAFFLMVGLALAMTVTILILQATKGKDFLKEKKESITTPWIGAFIVGGLCLILVWLSTEGTFRKIFSDSTYFNAPSQAGILRWALISGLFSLIITLMKFFFVDKDKSIDSLGLKAKWSSFWMSLLVACFGGVLVYLITLISTRCFNVDFRVYTYAVRLINGHQFVSGLRYFPFYFLFCLMAGICVSSATRHMKGAKGDIVAALIEVLPMCLFLLYQYGTLLSTGTAAYPNCALDGILVQGFFFTLVFLGIVQHRTLEKTGNIWLGVWANSIFITFVTLANTTVYNLA